MKNLETETQEFHPSDPGNCMSVVVSEPQQLPWKRITTKEQPASCEKQTSFFFYYVSFKYAATAVYLFHVASGCAASWMQWQNTDL